jgi:hypothetical protein
VEIWVDSTTNRNHSRQREKKQEIQTGSCRPGDARKELDKIHNETEE